MKSPGLPIFFINPEFLEELDYVNVSYDTRYGKISSNWENKSDAIIHHLEIPVNGNVMYKFPEMGNYKVLVNGLKIDNQGLEMIYLKPGDYEIIITK